MITSLKYLLLTASLMSIAACATQGTPDASQLPGKPVAALEACQTQSFYNEMEIAVNGAQGLSEEWLMDYAARAEACHISKQTLTDFVDRVWDSRKED